MDKVLALFPSRDLAQAVEVTLLCSGVEPDRLDVICLADLNRNPRLRDHTDLLAYFHSLLRAPSDWLLVEDIVEQVQHGKAAVIVRPRDLADLAVTRQILRAHSPERLIWRMASSGGVETTYHAFAGAPA